MCREVGIPKEVRIRRDLIDAHIEMQRFVLIMKRMDRMMSGSHREGFCLKTSDLDLMVWLSDQKVICDLSQISLYRIPQHTVILMEHEDIPPGFTRLKLMTMSRNTNVKSSCVKIKGETFISGSFFRKYHLQFFQNTHGRVTSSMQFGPCVTS